MWTGQGRGNCVLKEESSVYISTEFMLGGVEDISIEAVKALFEGLSML